MKNKTLLIIIQFLVVIIFNSTLTAQNIWQQTNGPFGGSIYCLGTSSTGNIFCSTFTGGGIYKSTNNGNSWFKVFGNNRDSWSWIIYADNIGNLYASCSGYGLIKSTDDGISWNQISSTLTPRSIAVNNNGDIFAGLNTGSLYRSTNNGTNWESINYGANGVNKILIKPNGTIYTAFPPFIRMSTNNGNNWSQINAGGMGGGNDMSLDSSGNLLVCNSSGIYRTSNDGVSWLQICDIPSLLSIAISGNGTIYSGNSSGKIYKSTNNGLNWNVVLNQDAVGGGSSVRDIMIKSDGKIFAGYAYLGIYRSLNEGHLWEKSNNGLSNQRMASFVSNGTKIFAGTFYDGLYYTTNKGYDWIFAGLENKYIFQMGCNGPENIFLYTPEVQGGMFRSTNGGINWQEVNTNLPQGNINQFLKVNNDFFAATEYGIYKTINNGDNWIYKGPHPHRFRYLKANSNQVIFASSDSRLFRSTDSGDSWEILDSLGYFIQSFCLSDSNNVYVIYSTRLYRSTNLGTNWEIADSTANYANITCNEAGNLFVSDWNGIYRSNDHGTNWQQINSGLTFTDVVLMNFDEQGYLYAGTGGAGMFRTNSPILNVQNIVTFQPKSFLLSQNYPNPFNPATSIKFEIPVGNGRGHSVKLVIYDLLGREITTLVNQQMQAGVYTVDWDASNYPSGVYFYTLVTANYRLTKKMVLLK